MAKCNELGGTLPLLDAMEDVELFSDETDYMTLVYLGATTNHNPSGSDRYIWTDNSRLNFLTDNVEIYAHAADIYKAGKGLVRRTMFQRMDGSGKCVAVSYSATVMEWKVVSLPCNVHLNVSLYCSARTTPKLYNTTLSTIHIGFAESNFRTIIKGQYCSNEDFGDYDYSDPDLLWWFQQQEMCLRIQQCNALNGLKPCEKLHTVCEPHEIYFFPFEEAHTLTFNQSSHIAKF